MHVCEADQQRAYVAWDLYESAKSDLSALLHMEDVELFALDVAPSVWHLLWDTSGRN